MNSQITLTVHECMGMKPYQQQLVGLIGTAAVCGSNEPNNAFEVIKGDRYDDSF